MSNGDLKMEEGDSVEVRRRVSRRTARNLVSSDLRRRFSVQWTANGISQPTDEDLGDVRRADSGWTARNSILLDLRRRFSVQWMSNEELTRDRQRFRGGEKN